jgi:hypothetical protein
MILRRAVCRHCGGHLKQCGGIRVHLLQRSGELHRMVMPPIEGRPPSF